MTLSVKNLLPFIFGLLIYQCALAQDTSYVRQMIDSLCAPRYHGRGYVQQGDVKAAAFIAREVTNIGLEAGIQFHEFELGVNTFPGRMELKLNETGQITGKDYIIDPRSRGCEGEFDAIYFKPQWAESREKLFKLMSAGKFENKFVVLIEDDTTPSYQSLLAEIDRDPLKAAGYILLTEKKLTWSVATAMISRPIFQLLRSSAPRKIKHVTANIDQKFESNHIGKNVLTVLSGTDSANEESIVFTAHLDHLGRMGADTYIPGANDNASGSAMLLDLYKYYLENRPEHSVVFIWFGGEEAGLVGSRNFVANPPINLEKINFLLNLDLMGDAKTGITAVNGKVFVDHFGRLMSLNQELGLLQVVKARGPAPNSDHHPFFEKGVPCFFFYTMGDYKHYHDINDRPENLPLTNYEKVFTLIVEFMNSGLD